MVSGRAAARLHPLRGREIRAVHDHADGGNLIHVVDTPLPEPAPSFSPGGRRILYTTGDSITTIRADGTEPRPVLTVNPSEDAFLFEAAYSPSGRRIVFAGAPGGNKGPGIWSMRRDGSRLRRLTWSFRDNDPEYSPDGRHIAFQRYGSPKVGSGIHVMRADGSHDRLITHTEDLGYPAYAPNGDRIVVSRLVSRFPVGPTCTGLLTMSPRGHHRLPATYDCDSGAVFPSWQPLPASP